MNEWEKEHIEEIRMLFSQCGQELQLCLVAQGYEAILFPKLMLCFGSGLSAIEVINELEKEINKK